jgi:hypothetical protein
MTCPSKEIGKLGEEFKKSPLSPLIKEQILASFKNRVDFWKKIENLLSNQETTITSENFNKTLVNHPGCSQYYNDAFTKNALEEHLLKYLKTLNTLAVPTSFEHAFRLWAFEAYGKDSLIGKIIYWTDPTCLNKFGEKSQKTALDMANEAPSKHHVSLLKELGAKTKKDLDQSNVDRPQIKI